MALALLLAATLLVPGCGPAPVELRADAGAIASRADREAPQPAAEIAPQQAKLGVHTRLTDEVEPWKIDRTFELVRAMGATWVVEYFPWAYHEPEPGRLSWEHSDLVVEAAARHGLKLLARVDMVPDWARPAGTSSRWLDEAHYDEFAAFAAAFVDRYRGRLAGLIVWNEPNVSSEWGFRPVSAAEYARLLAVTYPAVKAVAPDLPVLAAGLAPTLEQSEWGRSDLTFLEELYQLGAASYFDGLAAHAYGWQLPPDDPPAPDRISFRRVELLRAIMVQHGDAAKPILITEGGWNDHPRWTKAVRSAQRIAYTVRALEIATQDWPWLQAISFWAFRFPRPTRNYNDFFAFVNVEFTPRPIYRAVQSWAAGRPWQADSW